MLYKIYPLLCSTGTLDNAWMYYHGECGKKEKIQYTCFLLESETGEHMLVDSGCPLSSDIVKYELHSLYNVKENSAESMEALLGEYGVKPEEITKIFFTHLHYDHAWNLGCFPNAAFYAQRAEMQDAIAPLPHLARKTYALDPKAMKFNWLNYRHQFVPVDGETELAPGIRVIQTPGHSYGSQTILIDTAEGTYACCGDFAFRAENIEKCRPIGLLVDMGAWYQSYAKLARLMEQGVKLLPSHDISIMNRKVYG